MTVITLALGWLREKIYNNSTKCTHGETTAFGKNKEKDLEKKPKTTGKDRAKINNHTDVGNRETHHNILESLSHSALEVGSL